MDVELRVFSESDGLRVVRRHATSLDEATADARKQGLAVLSSREIHPESRPATAHRGNSAFPLLLFCRELLVLLDAGLPLLEAFETLAEKELIASNRKVIDDLADSLRAGQSLSAALGGWPDIFPPLFIASIHASEYSGAIPDALKRFIAYQVQVEGVRKKIQSAMVYPTLLLGAGGLVVIFLMGYVVPRFSRIYSERITELPWLSRLLLDWGRLIDANGPVALVIVLLCSLALWQGATSDDFRAWLFRRIASIPAVGNQLRLYQLTRLYRALGMLLRGGMAISPALRLVPGLLAGNLRQQLEAATERIREGLPISQAMAANGLATPVASRLLRVGERTGQMHEMMESIAGFHEDEIARRIELFTRTVEPVLMLAIGLIIGGIVILMYLPIFELAGSFNQ